MEIFNIESKMKNTQENNSNNPTKISKIFERNDDNQLLKQSDSKLKGKIFRTPSYEKYHENQSFSAINNSNANNNLLNKNKNNIPLDFNNQINEPHLKSTSQISNQRMYNAKESKKLNSEQKTNYSNIYSSNIFMQNQLNYSKDQIKKSTNSNTEKNRIENNQNQNYLSNNSKKYASNFQDFFQRKNINSPKSISDYAEELFNNTFLHQFAKSYISGNSQLKINEGKIKQDIIINSNSMARYALNQTPKGKFNPRDFTKAEDKSRQSPLKINVSNDFLSLRSFQGIKQTQFFSNDREKNFGIKKVNSTFDLINK